jgi:RNA polymerase sigma-70 factor (ECF subfamily)
MRIIEELYLEYKQDLYHYLLSITHDAVLSEDLLSETFMRAIFSIGNFKGNSSVRTWLFGIARHLWLQYLRKNKPMIEYSDLLNIYISDSTMEGVISKQLTERVFELIKTKDERTQQIVCMRINGISYFEISKKTNISENAARVIEYRAKRWLKAILEREELI